MKNNKKKYLVSVLVLVLLLPFGLYFLKSLNIYGTNFPCLGISDYTVGEFLEKNIEKKDKYYEYDESLKTMDLDVTQMKSGNINSMQGLSELPYAEEVRKLSLDGTCINQINSLEALSNLHYLAISNARINEMRGLENINNLRTLSLMDNNIETIENIENIRTDTSDDLVIFLDRNPIKYITKESYEYIMNPDNKVSVIITNEEGHSITINPVYGDSKEVVEEYLEII